MEEEFIDITQPMPKLLADDLNHEEEKKQPLLTSTAKVKTDYTDQDMDNLKSKESGIPKFDKLLNEDTDEFTTTATIPDIIDIEDNTSMNSLDPEIDNKPNTPSDINSQNQSKYIQGVTKGLPSRCYETNATLGDLVLEEGLVVRDVLLDGNCLFAAVVDQLRIREEFFYTTKTLREAAVSYLRENPFQEDGTPLEKFLTEHDGTWDQYLTRMTREGEWGDHLVISALANVLKRRLVILRASSTKLTRITMEPSKPQRNPAKPESSTEPKNTHEYSNKASGADDKAETNEGGREGLDLDDLYLGHIAEVHYVSLQQVDWEERQQQNDDDDDGLNILGDKDVMSVGVQRQQLIKGLPRRRSFVKQYGPNLEEDSQDSFISTSHTRLHKSRWWLKNHGLDKTDKLILETDAVLNDRIITAVQECLATQYPHVFGFQNTLLAPKFNESKQEWEQKSTFKFQPKPWAQILYDYDEENNHWVCFFSTKQGDVYCLDSLPRTEIKENSCLGIQLKQIYKPVIIDQCISINILTCQKQPNNHDCGLFAIANLVEILENLENPSNLNFNHTFIVEQMRLHLISCLENGKITPFTKNR